MAVSIRLKRMGRKKKPFYRLVVAHKSNPQGGNFVDDLGYYDPIEDPAEVSINEEKALMWLERGAEPTETARSLLSKQGILKKFHELRYPPKNAPAQIEEDETKPEEEEAKPVKEVEQERGETETAEQSDDEQ